MFKVLSIVPALTRSKMSLGLALVTGAATGSVFLSGVISSDAHASEGLEPPHYPWNHRFPWQSFDYASIRRGFLVYRQVCSTCHSLDRIAYRNLVNTCYTEEEVKEIAADRDFMDGPNEEGEMFERPGKLSDYMPRPYPNENSARYANNGAYPQDLSLIVSARARHEDYVFSLLTGYRDPPYGVTLRQGLYYNPYFPGGAIAMPQALIEGAMDFDDGTPSHISQMAKDVATFLAWTSCPEQDERKKLGLKTMFVLSLLIVPTLYWKRLKWSVLKSRVIQFRR
jgi:ubiquinol-cytochrome c reductase cytochrome c1 subunit